MDCYTIDFNGKTYRYTEVHHKGADMNVLIAEESLQQALIVNDKYVSDYAMRIDEKFYGYVDADKFDLSHDEFEDYVNEVLD